MMANLSMSFIPVHGPFSAVKIVEETVDYIVVEKPAGMIVHPNNDEEMQRSFPQGNTLVHWLLMKFPTLQVVGEDQKRSGIVHRLDKDVSGLMVVALNQAMFESLKKQFQEHRVKKEYIALVHGKLQKQEGVLEFPVGRSSRGHRMAAHPKGQGGRLARTEYEVLEYIGKTAGEHHGYSLLQVRISTGRTHQIRVHMHALGHPVVGDTLYRIRKQRKTQELGRLFLHASVLGFYNKDNAWVEYKSPLPQELEQMLLRLKK